MSSSQRIPRHVLTASLVCTLAVQPAAGADPFRSTSPRDHNPEAVHAQQADEVLPDRMKTSCSDHYAIVHPDGDKQNADVDQTLELLESTRRRFYRDFTNAGFRLRRSHRRFVWISIADVEQFVRYSRAIERTEAGALRSYYSPRTNNVVLVGLAPSQVKRDGSLLHGAPGPQFVLAEDHAPTEKTHPSPSAAMVTHEAAHQLAFNSGIQKRGVMYPLWATEGLATQFEAHSEDSLGISADNQLRRQRLLSIAGKHQLMPLQDFLILTETADLDVSQVDALYAQSWGVFRMLITRRPIALRRYLDHLAKLRPGRRDRTLMRLEIANELGSTEELQQDWQAFLSTIRKQTEEESRRIQADARDHTQLRSLVHSSTPAESD